VRIALVTSGLEHLGIEALSAWVRRAGHEPILVYEARPFSSGSGTDSRLLARLPNRPPSKPAAHRRGSSRRRRVHVLQRDARGGRFRSRAVKGS
jgi:hypothetical protein